MHGVRGQIRELRELVEARHPLQGKRVALINALRGDLNQEGQRLPAKCFQRRDGQEILARREMSEATRPIVSRVMRSLEALGSAEGERTARRLRREEERLGLVESRPGIGKRTVGVLLEALDDVDRVDDKQAVAKDGALAPTIDQRGAVVHLGRSNRDGRQEVRRVLVQGAPTVSRMRGVEAAPLRRCFERVASQRGKKIAIVA